MRNLFDWMKKEQQPLTTKPNEPPTSQGEKDNASNSKKMDVVKDYNNFGGMQKD